MVYMIDIVTNKARSPHRRIYSRKGSPCGEPFCFLPICHPLLEQVGDLDAAVVVVAVRSEVVCVRGAVCLSAENILVAAIFEQLLGAAIPQNIQNLEIFSNGRDDIGHGH